jgi:hypothetical protein
MQECCAFHWDLSRLTGRDAPDLPPGRAHNAPPRSAASLSSAIRS